MKRRHWIRFDGRGWFIPHGRITLDQGTQDLHRVTCRVCLVAAEKVIFGMQGALNAAHINLRDEQGQSGTRRGSNG